MQFLHAVTYTLRPLGDRALSIRLEGAVDAPLWKQAAELALRLRSLQAPWITDVIPAYDTVTVVYDPLLAGRPDDRDKASLPYEAASAGIRRLLDAALLAAPEPETAFRVVEIPVSYGGVCGPDLAECAARAGMDEAGFVALHAGAEYQVAMIGFMPGFPYLTGLPDVLAQPRRPSPRSRVPMGSVGIAGGQTGIYPLSSPGGWQLIGRTSLRLFDPLREKPFLLRAGDRLRFVPVAEEAGLMRGDA